MLAAQKVKCVLSCTTRGVASRAREVDAPLCSAPVRPHLEYWAPNVKKMQNDTETVGVGPEEGRSGD